MKITIKDVAKESGVNISTVSGVINNDSRISQETAYKVYQAIDKLVTNLYAKRPDRTRPS